MTDREYAIKSLKEITFQMATHAQDYLEMSMDRHYKDIKLLMVNYQKLILENKNLKWNVRRRLTRIWHML